MPAALMRNRLTVAARAAFDRIKPLARSGS
jgi:hypothetical protein